MHQPAPLIALLGLWAGGSHASPFDKAAAASSLSDCLTKAGVPVDTSGSPDYRLDTSSFNLRLNYTPVAVAAVTTTKHVQDAVACARQAGVKANAKCGGHSYASFGLGGEDGHLVIEMSRMNKVVLDNATGIATAEGGTRLGHLAWELWNQGNRAISHGTCPGFVNSTLPLLFTVSFSLRLWLLT
jgi:FAD/FMN-containing dehydrogenase